MDSRFDARNAGGRKAIYAGGADRCDIVSGMRYLSSYVSRFTQSDTVSQSRPVLAGVDVSSFLFFFFTSAFGKQWHLENSGSDNPHCTVSTTCEDDQCIRMKEEEKHTIYMVKTVTSSLAAQII